MTQKTDARGVKARILPIAVAILFGLFFAYDLFEAITNLVELPAQVGQANEFAGENGLQTIEVPWGILITNAVLPVAAFAVAWWVGRRRSVGHQALVFLMALAVVAALTLTLTAIV
jgi:lysylphosphatidylglycerol synthetase-like protein (DUF2156 family)